jgi:hypothetical protein
MTDICRDEMLQLHTTYICRDEKLIGGQNNTNDLMSV